MKRRFIIVTLILAMPVLYLAVQFVAALTIKHSLADVDYRVRHADFHAVLAGCREMMTNKDSYYPRRTDWPAESGVYIDFTVPAEVADPKIPKVIRDLQPGYVIIEKDSVLAVFQGGFSHLACRAFPEGVEGQGTEKLVDGLWLIHD
jgi:hypothetical protein